METADSAVYLFTQNYTQTVRVCVCVCLYVSLSVYLCVCVCVCVCVCALGWVKYREHISLLAILCIIVYDK